MDHDGAPNLITVVSTAARVEAAAHGGQVVCTDIVRAVAGRDDLIGLGTHRLRDVAEPLALFQIGGGEFPTLRVVPPQLIRLPAPANPLVGQVRVLRSVRAALLDHRLVTLSGVGGAGKTRLALEVGEKEMPHFPDGVVFVDSDDGRAMAEFEAGWTFVNGGANGSDEWFYFDGDGPPDRPPPEPGRRTTVGDPSEKSWLRLVVSSDG